jgi:hypothetical protein
MEFNYEKHQKLWHLLSEHIAEAIKANYEGNGYYNAYSALEKLKRKLLLQYFSEEDRRIHNLCFACSTAYEEQWANWYDTDNGLDCRFCPLQWPNERHCDDSGSLYVRLVQYLEDDNVADAAAICITIANVKPFTTEEYEKKIPGQQPW